MRDTGQLRNAIRQTIWLDFKVSTKGRRWTLLAGQICGHQIPKFVQAFHSDNRLPG